MGKLAEYRKALQLAETATATEVVEAFAAELQAEMTPEEIAAKKKKDEEAAAAAAAAAGDAKTMGEHKVALAGLYKLDAKAEWSAIIAAATSKLAGSEQQLSEVAGVQLQLKELTDKVAVLEPMAQKAEKLEADAKLSERNSFLSEQLRAGKLLPAERPFYEEMWTLSEAKVRAHFKDRKPVVPLAEIGHAGEGDKSLTDDADPREKLQQLAEARMKEKTISYTAALEEIKGEQKELVEKVAAGYGPSGVRR